MIKILINASMYSASPAGVGIYIREIWNRLPQNEQVRYDCYTFSEKDLKNNKNIFLIKNRLLKSTVSLHRLIWNFFYLPIIAKKYDLVYSFSSHGSPFIKNQIITIHDLINFNFPRQHRFQSFYFRYLLPSIITSCKKIVAISAFTKSEIEKYYKINAQKIEVISNGGNHLESASSIVLSEDEMKSAKNLPKNFFLVVGATYPHKNVQRVIEAMEYVPDYSLVIVSSISRYYKTLKKKIIKDGKKSNIIFFESVTQDFLKMLYQKCTANVYVSLNEGFGFPPFEAALQNKTSIVANTGALKEVYGDSMIQVNPFDVEDIGKAFKKISSGTDLSEYINRFSEVSNNYTWEKAVSKINNLISKEVKCSRNTI